MTHGGSSGGGGFSFSDWMQSRRQQSMQMASALNQPGGGGSGGRTGGKIMSRQFMERMDVQAAKRTRALEKQRARTLKLGRAAFERARGELSKVGGAARERIGMSRERRLGSSQQSLISRGLGNTTILDTAGRGIESDIGREQLSLDDMLARQRSGLEERAGGFELNLGQFGLQSMGMQPNMQDFMRMLQQMQQFS